MYQQYKDLILVGFFGFIYYAIVIGLNGHMTQVPLGEYFMAPFLLALFMGFSIRRPFQMFEWPLCFLFGGMLGSLHLILIVAVMGMPFSFLKIAYTLSYTFAWFGVLSSMILVGILISNFLKMTYDILMGSLNINEIY